MATAGSRISPPVVAACAWFLTVGLSVVGSALGAAHGRPPEVYLPLTISGLVYATAGAVMYMRRPDNASGLVLISAATLPAALLVLRYLMPSAVALNIAFSTQVALVPLAYVVLTFPSDRFASRLDRMVFVVVAALGVAGGIVELASMEPQSFLPPDVCSPCPPNPFRLVDANAYPTISAIDNTIFAVVAGSIVFVLVKRWRASRGLTRSALTPVVFGAAVLATGYAATIWLSTFGISANVVAPLLLGFRLLVPIGLAVVFLRFYAARSSVVRELVRLGPRTSMAAVQSSLRRTLGDPSIAVLRWSEHRYVDTDGRPVETAGLDTNRRLVTVDRDGTQVAAVTLDPVLDADRELVAAIADSVRYATESSEMHEELVARGGDVERLPQGDVTFLFGDLERSTELLQRLGDAYAGTIARLREIVRREVERNSGYVVDMRADECFLAFALAADALSAAAGIQRDIELERWPAGAEVRLRIGLHAGRPELTASGYVGLDVHHAARVMASALGGQIIASQALVEALGGSSRPDVTLSPLGTFSLRGIPGEESLFEVRAT